MAKPSPKLLWCIIRFGDDMNWWVKEISDDVHWDTDGLSIIDPKQISYILDLIDPLREYGLSTDLVEEAFIPFQIQQADPDQTVKLVRVNESFFESDEMLFGLPDIVDEEKGPYAELIDHITRLRVKFLNDNIDFEQKLTIEELEEQVREMQNQAFMEGRALHVFQEITDILEFVPAGYELADADDAADKDDEDGDDGIDVGDDFELDPDEKIEEDDTMRWDEGEEDEEEEEDDAPHRDDDAYDLDAMDEDDEDDRKPARRKGR